MDNRVKFYSWLIGLLDRKHLTFEEIANEWRDANANQDEDELDKRTFHRYNAELNMDKYENELIVLSIDDATCFNDICRHRENNRGNSNPFKR